MKKIKHVISHRGAIGRHPENSLAGILLAMACGCIPEIDFRVTKEHIAVALHDDSIKQSCNGPDLLVKEHTYPKLSGFPLCSGDRHFHKITLAEDVFKEMTADPNRQIAIDIKDPAVVPVLKMLMQKHKVEKQTYIICRLDKDCDTAKTNFPNSRIIWSCNGLPDKIPKSVHTFCYCAEKGKIDDVLSNPKKHLTKFAHECKKQNVQFGVVILDKVPPSILKQLIELKIDMIGIEDINRYQESLKKV